MQTERQMSNQELQAIDRMLEDYAQQEAEHIYEESSED